MSQQPFLKSIHPVNLLSFGPNTKEIELRPLNILIGPNGCGKSNLIEIVRLLHYLPDKDPWTVVLQTGGVDEWIWKGQKRNTANSSIKALISLPDDSDGAASDALRTYEYSIVLGRLHSSFYLSRESLRRSDVADWDGRLSSSFESSGAFGELNLPGAPGRLPNHTNLIALSPEKSVFSQLTSRGIQEA